MNWYWAGMYNIWYCIPVLPRCLGTLFLTFNTATKQQQRSSFLNISIWCDWSTKKKKGSHQNMTGITKRISLKRARRGVPTPPLHIPSVKIIDPGNVSLRDLEPSLKRFCDSQVLTSSLCNRAFFVGKCLSCAAAAKSCTYIYLPSACRGAVFPPALSSYGGGGKHTCVYSIVCWC